MDKIEKVLNALNTKERIQVKHILLSVQSKKFKGLDIKKLKGVNDVFRVRKGNIRIIYKVNGKNIFVLAIERRNEKTYKSFI